MAVVSGMLFWMRRLGGREKAWEAWEHSDIHDPCSCRLPGGPDAGRVLWEEAMLLAPRDTFPICWYSWSIPCFLSVSTTGLVDMCTPSFGSLSQAHFQGRTSSPRYGYHRAKAPPVLSRYLIGCWPTSTTAHCPAVLLYCERLHPASDSPTTGSIRALQRAPHTLKYCQTRQSSIFMEQSIPIFGTEFYFHGSTESFLAAWPRVSGELTNSCRADWREDGPDWSTQWLSFPDAT